MVPQQQYSYCSTELGLSRGCPIAVALTMRRYPTVKRSGRGEILK